MTSVPPKDISRFFRKIKILKPNGCWIWTSCRNKKGYAQFFFAGKCRDAHRWIFEQLLGIIPKEKELHHTCNGGSLGCVNPFHLNPITRRDHIHISNGPCGINARKTHCIYGHPLSGKNLYRPPDGGRVCRTCLNRDTRAYRARIKNKKITNATKTVRN